MKTIYLKMCDKGEKPYKASVVVTHDAWKNQSPIAVYNDTAPLTIMDKES